MAPSPDTEGVCPHCGQRFDQVGVPCPEPICTSKGPYYLIPPGMLESAMAFSRKKSAPLDPLIGRQIDRYLVLTHLGSGGMGAVYLAQQLPLRHEVALKTVSGIELTDATLSRFEREARAIALLDHPNIVKLHDYGIAHLGYPVPYMAMEYVRNGKTLRSLLQEAPREACPAFDVSVTRSIFTQILFGLSAAHGKGIVHRDMKPDNVVIKAVEGHPFMVKILDFGLAKAFSDVGGFTTDLTAIDQLVGTPQYMAPEQILGSTGPKVDARVDLYAVNVMLYQILTRKRPFPGREPSDILKKKMDSTFDPMANPETDVLSDRFREFLQKGFEKDPDRRFASAEEMRRGLEWALDGEPIVVAGGLSATVTAPWGGPEDAGTTPAGTTPKQLRGRTVSDLGRRKGRARRSAGIVGLAALLLLTGFVYLALDLGALSPGVSADDTVTSADAEPVATLPLSVATNVEPSPGNSAEPIPAATGVVSAPAQEAAPAILVRTQPPGASITLNDSPVGRSPLHASLTEIAGDGADSVVVRASLPGYRTATIRVSRSDAVHEGVFIELSRVKEKASSPRKSEVSPQVEPSWVPPI